MNIESLNNADLIINATSVGMMPHTNISPMPNGVAFPRQAIVCDLVYRPMQTKFLRDAEHAGAQTIGGLGMLLHQGALSLKLWTGRDAPIKLMLDAAHQELRNT